MYLAFHVRDRFNATPVAGLPVPLKRHSDDVTVMTVNSDASGLVEFIANGNLGDCYAVVEQGGEKRIYSTRTTAPSGSFQVGEAGDFLSAVGPGVVDGLANGMAVSPSGMGVSVATGGVWLANLQHRMYTPQSLTIPTAHPTNPRIDVIVARADRTNRTSTVAVLQGTAQSSPVAPSLTQSAATWEEALAQVTVDAGVTTIVPGKVADVRRYASARIADGGIATAKLADGSVTTAKVAASAVTSAKIADANVTTAKVADGAITQTKHANASVGTAQLIDANVTTAKLADGSVTSAKIADGTIVESDLATAVVTKLNATGGSSTPSDGSVTTAKLADNSVTSAKIVNATIVAADIANATITGTQIAAGTVAESNLTSAVQTKLNATGSAGPAPIVAENDIAGTSGLVANGSATGATGSVILTTSITIPNDGNTWDLEVEGNAGLFNSANVFVGVEVRAGSTVSGFRGGAGATYRMATNHLDRLAIAAGTYTLSLAIRTASGTVNYDYAWIYGKATAR